MEKIDNKNKHGNLKVIAMLGLLTATLDGVAAILSAPKFDPPGTFKFIASGMFGKAAFNGGVEMVLVGVFSHYLIAMSITAVLIMMYPIFISFLKNKYVVAVVFALITWVITHLLIVPLSRIGWSPINFGGIPLSVGILIITIGLPIVLIADWYFFKESRKNKTVD